MKNLLNHLLVLMAFVWFLFPVYFTILPAFVWTIIYYAIIVVYLIWRYKVLKKFLVLLYPYRIQLLFFAIIYGIACLWAIVVIILSNSNDYNYIKYLLYFLRNIACFIFLLILVRDILKPKSLHKKFVLLYIYACCCYVLSTTIMLFCPELRSIWMNVIYISELNEGLTELENYITRFGLSGFSGFYHTYLCTMGVILAIYLFNKIEYKLNLMHLILLFLLLLLGNFYYGRSGAILSLICIMLTMTSFFKIKYFKKISLLCACIVIIACIVYTMQDSVPEIALWMSWALDPVNKLIDSIGTGSISIGSSGDTMFENMYFIPDNDFTILFGDGKYGCETSYYMNTDVGFMRAMLFYGVIGCFLGYFSLCILLWVLYKVFKKRADRPGEILVFMIFLQFIFFELKGDPYKFLFGIVFALILANLYDSKMQEAK